MTLQRTILVLVCALLMSACASRQPSRALQGLKPNEALLAPGIHLTIPHPTKTVDTTNVTQSVVARFGDQTIAFDAHIQIASGELDLVALDSFGRRVMTLRWTADGVTQSASTQMESRLRPADILAGIALVYWPKASLLPATSAARLTLVETARSRTISDASGTLVRIDYEAGRGWNRGAKLTNYRLGYTITIQSTNVDS